MSEFFDSEIVKETMRDLGDMQEELFKQAIYLPTFSKEKRKEHIQLMKDFLEKQKLLFVRMSLSDDPEAIETKEKIMESAKIFGLIEGEGMDQFFNTLNETIEKLEKSLEL